LEEIIPIQQRYRKTGWFVHHLDCQKELAGKLT